MNLYSELILPYFSCVSEKKSSYSWLTERHIQAIWLEQKYFRGLQTLDGRQIEVLSPGIWNTEAGPDFLKAHIRIGFQEFRGDIEIHLSDESWIQHHHHVDERYDQVVLHLSFWTPLNPRPLVKSNGQELIRVYLEDALTVPITRLLQLVDLDLYPYKKFSGSGQCATVLFKTLSEDKIENLFISAAQWRLEQKKSYLQARIPTFSLQLVGGIAMALGYKNNAESFLDLFLFLYDYRDMPEDILLAIGLGCGGFFDQHAKPKWKESEYYQNLQKLWWGQQSLVIHQIQLKLDHVRPLNNPIRRIVYLAKLLADPHLEKIWERLLELWQFSMHEIHQGKLTSFRQKMLEVIPSYEDPYWNYHYTFENDSRQKFLSLMGDNLKSEILVNAILPLLYVCIRDKGNLDEWRAFQIFYGNIQASRTGKSRYLAHRFFGDTAKGELLNKAQIEQGAYQLHKDFCVHYEASCIGCPFVDRYKQRIKDEG